MPDVEIDIDDLLDADSEEERALKLRVSSFQNLEPSGHRCQNPLGLPELGMHQFCPVEMLAQHVGMATCREESSGMLSVHPHEVHLW